METYLSVRDTLWKLEQEEPRVLNELKEALAGDQVMSCFDPIKKPEIIVDASPFGLSGLLIGKGNVFGYASRAPSDAESRYSQTEREMFAVEWRVERSHLYMYVHDAQFSVIIDQKPLIGMFRSHKHAPLRIERWKLRLMPHDCQLFYRPERDAENADGSTSRDPSSTAPDEPKLAKFYVKYVVINAVPTAVTFKKSNKDQKRCRNASCHQSCRGRPVDFPRSGKLQEA